MHTRSKKILPDWHIVSDQCHIYTCSARMANLPCDMDNHGRLHSSACMVLQADLQSQKLHFGSSPIGSRVFASGAGLDSAI